MEYNYPCINTNYKSVPTSHILRNPRSPDCVIGIPSGYFNIEIFP